MREFLALLGHELGNPLAAMRYALCVLNLQGDDAVTRDRTWGVLDRQLQFIACLVNDLMDVSRIELGKIELHIQPLNLAQALVRAAESVRGPIEKRGHQLEVALPPDSVSLDADPVRLEQVLTNLLNNASKYTDAGGRIWLTAEVQGGDVVFHVRDSGIGIAPEMLPHVFDPFWQAEPTLDPAQCGFGIGLALVRKLAELHGGSAGAYSEGLNRGSEFVVRLPCTRRG
ncbi:sensor histidine kinase [Frigoriglobus tundricola]|nr:HAMP domain-containing sensor histidine kinase [Frigoriglobus tundricola]